LARPAGPWLQRAAIGLAFYPVISNHGGVVSVDIAADFDRNTDRFVTTRWSMVLSCSENEQDKARLALADLCKIYWRPIFAFIRQRGYSIQDAQDLTQGFFLTVLEGKLLERADPNRGRFRALLLKALQDFLVDDTIRANALKRGGGVQFVSWDEWMSEAVSDDVFPATPSDRWPAEKVYDARWAATAAGHALRRLGEECEARGHRPVFDVMANYLAADRDDLSYSDLAQTLQIPATQVKRLLHQFRVRYRELLRAEVAQTVERLDQVDEELRYLCAALATRV
jgi:DNA-directed RNA polymerase specialized sigma24 family protein